MIDALEPRVYADAANAARAAADARPGVLVPFERQDQSGRTITEFHGDIGAFMAPFTRGGLSGSFIRPGK